MPKLPHILHWLYPNRCLFCRTVLPAEAEPACDTCRKQELAGAQSCTTLPSGLRVVTALRYRELSRRLLLRYKFYRQPGLCRPIARLMAQALRERLPDEQFDCVTWVPTGFWRLSRRGYDQSGLLARELGRILDIPCQKLIVKRGHNRQQSSLGYDQRAANVRGVYRARRVELPMGARVLLVDDVVTSGSTISSAAEVLIARGMDVTGVCMASARHGRQ